MRNICLFEKLEFSLYEVYQKEIAALDAEIEKCLASFEPKTLDKPPTTIKKRRKKPTANHPPFDLHKYIYRIAGVDFTLIDGLDALTVQTILSEVGLDPERFPTVKHFTSRLTVYVLVKKLLVVKLKALKLVPLLIVQPMLSVWLLFPSPKAVLLSALFIAACDRA